MENGLQETRLFQLKKSEDEDQLLLIINAQILSLVTFLNVSRNFNEDQVMDTAEIILEEYDDFSFTAIMDCFHRIKTAKHPFDKKLYEGIDGRKLLEMFNIYRELQSEHLEQKHKETKSNAGNVLKQAFMVSPDDFEDKEMKKLKPSKKKVMSEMQKLVNKLKYEKSLKRSPMAQEALLQEKANKGKATTEEIERLQELIEIRKSKEVFSPMNQMVTEWLEEFQELRDKKKLPPKIVMADEYIRYKRSQIQLEGEEVEAEQISDWSQEFMKLHQNQNLPDGITTFSQFIEFKTF